MINRVRKGLLPRALVDGLCQRDIAQAVGEHDLSVGGQPGQEGGEPKRRRRQDEEPVLGVKGQRADDDRPEQPPLVPARGAVLQVVADELDVVLAVTGHRRSGNEPHQRAQPEHDEPQRAHDEHSAEKSTGVVLTGAARRAGSIVGHVAAILRSGGGGRSTRLTCSARWR